MQVYVYDNYEALSIAAAKIVAEALKQNPALKLGFSTGSTPLGLYAELVRLHKSEGLSFSKAFGFNLDEYLGLPACDEQSYHFFMQEQLYRHIDIPPENSFIPDATAKDPTAEAARYEGLISAHGGIDLQILGVGTNGHIGFNEPGSPWDSPCRVADLAYDTLVANARFFDNDMEKVPKQAITMGIATILAAKRIIFMASGQAKAEIIGKILKGEQTLNIPATALQNHPDVALLLDKAAALDVLLPNRSRPPM